MADELSKFIPKRHNNGPIMPRGGSVFDAEAENAIRKHYALRAELEELKTDRDFYRNRTELAEAIVEKLKRELGDEQAENLRLRDLNTELRTHLEHGVDSWVKALDILKAAPQPKVVITPVEEKKDEPASPGAIFQSITDRLDQIDNMQGRDQR